jgi:site-specific recombinase XerD
LVKVASAGEFLTARSADVVRYRNSLQRRKLSAATVNQRLAAIRGIYRRLMKENRIERNPADPDLAPGLRVSAESRTEGLSLDELKMILATCDGTLRGLRDRALLLTLYYEGLRRSEASKLNWRDITTRRGLIEVRDAKNNPYDTVRLRPEARQAIENYHEVLNMALRRRETRPEDPVFVSISPIRSYGERLAADSINKIVKARAKAAGFKRRVSAHVLRHCCATEALQAGVPLHQVQRHLRHKDVRTTLRYDRERDVWKNPTSDALPSIASE